MMNDETLLKNLNEFELRCVTGNFENYVFPMIPEIYQSCPLFKSLEVIIDCFLYHTYEKVLEATPSDYLLKIPTTFDFSKEFRWSFIECDSSIDSLVYYVQELLLFLIGISALQVFVKVNLSGPEIGNSQNFRLCSTLLPQDVFSEDDCSAFLSKNGEFPTTIYQPRLLCLANLFLSTDTSSIFFQTSHWWRIRFLMIHQQKLPDRISSMHNEMVSLFNKTVCMQWMKNPVYLFPQVMFYIESAQMHLYYHEVTVAHELVDTARKLVGLGVELSGAYGKKTHYQQKAMPQLLVKLQRDSNRSSVPLTCSKDFCFPIDLNLDDDTLLNKVSFVNQEENCVESLLPEEQIVLFGYCCLTRHSVTFDDLALEELICFINCLLEQPKIWSIYLTTLIMRCRVEKKSSRHIERSLMQLEEVIDAIRKEEPLFSFRLPMLYCVAFPTIQSLEKELADMWMTLGGTKTALTIYERLGLWKEIVSCYRDLGRTSCAEILVKEQLQKKETPELFCLLGDVTDDPAMYYKAFELSVSNACSQRSLGYYFYKRKNYEKSVSHFSKSLEINHLQPEVWFSLGYAALQCENYETAAHAYRQVVTFNQDNFQAWNNLSSAYIQLQQKERAWRSLQEAVRCNYEDWHVWENLLLVSTDIGAFEDVLRSWHRLIDIKGKYQDKKILNILVHAVNEDLPDISGMPSSRIRQRTLQLIGRISSTISNDWDLWECYSLLQCSNTKSEKDKKVLEKALIYQQKAVRCSLHFHPWKDPVVCKKVIESAIRLAQLFSLSVRIGDHGSINQLKSTSRLLLQPVVLRLEKCLASFETSKCQEMFQQLEEGLLILKSIVLEIQNFDNPS